MMPHQDLRRQLDLAATRMDEACPPGAAQAIRSGRRRVAYRRIGAAGAGLVVAAVLVGSLVTLQQAFRGTPGTAAGSAADPASQRAYELSGFSIDFPWPEGSTQNPTGTIAAVRFEATWLTPAFPGKAECELTLLKADGTTVGSATFFASYLGRSAHPPPIVVDVSAPPEVARGMCGPGVYPPGAGYVFPEIAVDESNEPGKMMVEFEAVWASKTDPTWRECQLEARLLDGTKISQTFMLHVPDRTVIEREIDASRSSIADVSVACAEVS